MTYTNKETTGDPWQKIIQMVIDQHNGVMSVDLHFGHDGDRTCRFRDYEKVLASYSCTDMQKSVEKCLEQWITEMLRTVDYGNAR